MPDTILAISLSSIAAAVVFWRGLLTPAAALLAALFGAVILRCAGWPMAVSVAGAFLLTSFLSLRRDRIEGAPGNAVNARRDALQIFANGFLVALLAALQATGTGEPTAFDAAMLGCIGAVAGDTWATELARFSPHKPRLITTLRQVEAGTPGAVSVAGLLLSAAAGTVTSLLFLVAALITEQAMGAPLQSAALVLAATIGALAGSAFDSLLGATCQAQFADQQGKVTDRPMTASGRSNRYLKGRRWLGNDFVNFGNSVAGATVAYGVWVLASPAAGA